MRKIIITFVTLVAAALVAVSVAEAKEITPEDWIMETKISNGLTVGDFGGEFRITGKQLTTLCNRAFEYKTLFCYGDRVTAENLSWRVLKGLGLDYPESLAYEVASETGIIPKEWNRDKAISRSDAAFAIYQVANERYSTPEPKVKIQVEDGYLEHELDIVPYILQINKLPDQVSEAYHGIVTIGRKNLDEYGESHNKVVGGLYYRNNSWIYVRAPYHVLHEFGHFWDDHINNYGQAYSSLFRKEKYALSNALNSKYVLTNQHEFYASGFRSYLLSDQIVMKNCPLLWERIERDIQK